MRRISRIVTLLVIVLLGGIGTPAPTEAQPSSTWGIIGPHGLNDFLHVAVAQDWPASRLIFASTKGGETYRSRDGGETWQRLGRLPCISVSHFTIPPPSPDGTRVIFAYNWAKVGTVERLCRSVDEGATWDVVLRTTAMTERTGERVYRPFSLVLLPSFATVGTAYAWSDGDLFRSSDFGQTWSLTSPSAATRHGIVAFSPDFANDQTAFTSADGVLISHDGGATWMNNSTGLEHDGKPYRRIDALAVSPTFATDATVFVWAASPPPPEGINMVKPLDALFRSTDGGATWSWVWDMSLLTATRWRPWMNSPTLTLSRSFATDSVMLLTNNETGGGSRLSAGQCDFFRSADRGVTWATAGTAEQKPYCSEPTFAESGGATTIFQQHGNQPCWQRSLDLGQTWEAMTPPENVPTACTIGIGTVAADGTMITAGYSGIVAFGPDVRDTAGTLLP